MTGAPARFGHVIVANLLEMTDKLVLIAAFAVRFA